jgi:hypothetical protein
LALLGNRFDVLRGFMHSSPQYFAILPLEVNSLVGCPQVTHPITQALSTLANS